jgi:hypothetical protein
LPQSQQALRVVYPSAKARLIHMDKKVNVVSICSELFFEGVGERARKTLSAYIYILAIHFPVPPR